MDKEMSASPAQPLRVAQILNRMDSGGIEAVVMNYYRHIDHNQIQFDFYLAEDSSFPQREELERSGAGICLIPAYSKVFAYHKALYNAFRQHRYTIVHAHLSTMSVFPLLAALRAGVPVRICHNHSTANRGEGKKALLKYLLRPLNKLFSNRWFACGEAAGRWMYGTSAFDGGKVTVLPNAIDTARFAFDADARTGLRRELSIPENAFVIGHVGRFTYAKNHSFLIDLFSNIAKEHPSARLLLVGEGELEEDVRRQVSELHLQDQVIFAGVRRDVNKLYSAMDVFCMPSNFEGMPVVAWEAQANGLPCVFSDQMSAEAVRSTASCQLPLAAGTAQWQNALLSARRNTPTDIPDIRTAASMLESFYLTARSNIRSKA